MDEEDECFIMVECKKDEGDSECVVKKKKVKELKVIKVNEEE